MKNLYPRFQEIYEEDELIEHFWLTNDEIAFVETFRNEVNRQTAAILLKSLDYLGYLPDSFDQVPEQVKLFIARQLNSLWEMTNEYDWLSSAKDRHCSLIREFSGWNPSTAADKENLIQWLQENGVNEIGSEDELFEIAINHLKQIRLELPSQKELERITTTARNNIFQKIYRQIENSLSSGQKQKLDELLVVTESETFTAFDKLKSLSGKAGVENLSKEAAKLKQIIGQSYGILDLLDVFVEADNLAEFTSSFRHSGTKQVRSREQLRPLILLNLFAEGTNTGIKRIAQANHFYKYDELLYVRKNYFSPEALRLANIKVVNKILELRNPNIWGTANAAASDGKRFGSWNNNLLSEWKNRYKGNGVLIYWHVQTNAVCLYSQMKSFSSSEVAAMIEGLVRHDTEMRVEKNFVDSHGQSEVAFAFCKLLGFQLMPRLKRIKYEKLYLPDKGLSGEFENLKGVLTRPIRWELIESQYDEMMKHAVALKLGTANAEAILRRFNSYNTTHPTYKAFAELGKAEKTIFLCKYLSSIELRYEINEGLNVVERWNGVNDFIRYGRQGMFATNSREHQEISTLALQLLQNCLMLINTILVERTIEKEQMINRLSVEDLRALSPLFYEHINPYGVFEIDVNRPSFLQKEAI